MINIKILSLKSQYEVVYITKSKDNNNPINRKRLK